MKQGVHMQDEQQALRKITISMPLSRLEEFEAALQTLQQRKPSESISEIIADAVITAAISGDDEPEDTHEEAEWDRVFAQSQDRHARLAAKLRGDRESGRTQPLDPERL